MLELFKLVRPHIWHVLGVVLSSLVASGATAGMAWFVKYYVDEVLINTEPAYMAALPIVFILLFSLKGCFVFAQGFLVRAIGAKIILDLRKELYRHLINMPLGFFHRNPSGSLISRMLNDANVIQSNIVQGTKGLFVELFTVIGLLGVAFWRRWDLTLITIFVLPPALVLVNRILKRIKSVSHSAQASISNLTDVLTETFQGMKIIKAFLLESSKDASFDAENRSYYRLELKNVRLSESAALIMDVVAGFGVGFVIWYGGHLARTHQMTPGDFSSYIAAVAMVFTPMKRLATVNAKLLQATAAHERIVSVMTIKPERDGTAELPLIRESVQFEDVHLRYEEAETDALGGVNLTVRAGEVLALVGRSGAGKTSLVDLIPRFFRPTSGRVLIDGHDISEVRAEDLRKQIGLVSQDIVLFDDTVARNIGMGREGSTPEEIEAAARAAFAHDFIMELPEQYETRIGERGVMLSGGQRQRISIARAILKNPPILILDEATSALDRASELAVQRALENLMQNRTTFVIAHRLSTVRRADRIVVLDRGRVVEMGAHGELLAKKGVYAELSGVEFR